ncbi:hypothetical protein NKH77_30500 [Streptomyces sp. M19]
MTKDNIAKLTDFGISRALWSDVTQSRTGGIPGKPRYLPRRWRAVNGRAGSRTCSRWVPAVRGGGGHSPYGEAEHP